MLKRASLTAAAATNRNPAAHPIRPRMKSPLKRQNRWRDPEGHDVGERVELEAEGTGRSRQARDPSVEHVEHEREADEERGGRELTAYRMDNAGVATEQVRHREHARQQVDAAAQTARTRIEAGTQRSQQTWPTTPGLA
jgi:hypothetical protein